MKHWPPDSETAAGDQPQTRDAWITWLNHAPLHGVSPDRRAPAGWAGFGMLSAVGAFWVMIAWVAFGR